MKTFEELGVNEAIRDAIVELGFEHPMPVQEEVIPYLLGENNDVIALAQTGTGKTAAYGIPVLQKTDATIKTTQALILSPTRELCLQIADDLKSFGKNIDGLHIVAVYGGASITTQIHELRHGAQIIVATPGRLIDLMERKVVKLDNLRNIVLDEADEMLNMGFSDSINTIFEAAPADRNTLLFSATMSKEIEKIAKSYLTNYKEIVVGSRNEGAENVNHIYYLVNAKDKYLALKRIADFYPHIYAIIFCRTKIETQEVADKLIKDGYNAEALHGDLSQQQRDLTMQKFRQHTIQLLEDWMWTTLRMSSTTVCPMTLRIIPTVRAGQGAQARRVLQYRLFIHVRNQRSVILKRSSVKTLSTAHYLLRRRFARSNCTR